MKIQGQQTLPAPVDQVWKLLIDPLVLKRCTPGCERLELTAENTYEADLNVGIGAVKGQFSGRIRFDELQSPTHLKLLIDGQGAQGFVRGTGILDLTELERGTGVAYTGNVQLGGPIASVGQRMLQNSAKMLAGQFFTAMAAEAAALTEAEATGQAVVAPKQGFIRNLLRYLWSLLKRVFGQ